MRQISPTLQTAQELDVRYPISKIEVYDAMLRWREIMTATTGSFSSVYDMDLYTDHPDGPAAFSDAAYHNGHIYSVVYAHTADARPFRLIDYNPTGQAATSRSVAGFDEQRMSVEGQYIYAGHDTGTQVNLRRYNSDLMTYSTVRANISGSVGAYAAVITDQVYHAWVEDSAIHLEFITPAIAKEMDYIIPVSEDYADAALSWFDAVRLDDETDVIVVNVEPHGQPKIILRQNGVWSDPLPMIPIDVVDNYSYLRIGWMKVDNGVIYATGELGRRGSTGKHPQSMAVVLRSKDGVHWSLDRWRYLGQTPFRSPLMMVDGYAYTTFMPHIYRAPLTPLFGLQDSDITEDHVHFVIDEDILGWSAAVAGSMEPGTLNISLSNPGRIYSSPSSPTYIKPGYMLKLYAGYKAPSSLPGDPPDDTEYAQIGWYGVDSVPKTIAASSRRLSLVCREWNLRSLADNYFDQDWQWLSQSRHYDDCDQRDYLYSIGEGTIQLLTPDDERTVMESEPTGLDDGKLKVFDRKGRTTLVSTTPFEMKDGFASVMFKVDGWYGDSTILFWTPGLYNYGLRFDASKQHIGTGAGPAIIDDEHNLITAFLDVKSKSLYLVRISGTKGEETWDVLASHNLSWPEDIYDAATMGDRYYEVWMDVTGATVKYGVIATEWKTWLYDIESDDEYRWGTEPIRTPNPNPTANRRYKEWEATVSREGENRAGVVIGASAPYVKLMPNKYSGRACGRDHNEYQLDTNEYGEEIIGYEPYYIEKAEYAWDDYKDCVTYWLDPSAGDPACGFMYDSEQERVFLNTYGLTPYGEPVGPDRGDWISGQWTVRAVDTSQYESHNRISIELDPTEAYPPGEDSSYWLTTSDSFAGSGFYFTSGDLEGNFFDCSKPVSAGANIRFALGIDYDLWGNQSYDENMAPQKLPAVGDTVVFGPGLYPIPEPYNNTGGKFYWNKRDVGVTLHSFIAYDRTYEKSILWTLKDIAAKAGVLDILPGPSDVAAEYSVDASFSGTGYNFLDKQLDDFDLHVALSDELTGQMIIYLGTNKKYTTTPTNDDDRVGIIITNGTTTFNLTLYSFVNGTRISHLERTMDSQLLGKNFRIVKRGEFVSVWSEHRLLFSYPVRAILPEFAYADKLVGLGYVGFKLNQPLTYTVRQVDLWSRADGIIADQGMNALQALDRVIRDARIKVLADESLALRISAFEQRDDLGQAPDVILQDDANPTDAIPTHIRVIGEEIGEYFDHEMAAEYGVTFRTRNVESLNEEEAYWEASQIVEDVRGNAEGRSARMGGQLHYEPEDTIDVLFVTTDGEQVDATCVINDIAIQYGRAMLEMTVSLRKTI